MKMQVDSTVSIKLYEATNICYHLMKVEKETGVRNTPIFLGPPGQGKTSMVEQLVVQLNKDREEEIERLVKAGSTVHEAEEAVGPEWEEISFRLSQCDPTDLKGVPIYTKVDGHEMCAFAPPGVFPIVGLPNSANGKNKIIFLDELPQANPTMQNLAANIIDGKVGDHIIDFNRSFIICAGNRKEDHAATYETPRNVGNRLIKFNVITSFNEWKDWAITNGLHSSVIGYLEDKQIFFNEKPPENGYIYGTPRSWHKVSCQMLSMGEEWYDEKTSTGMRITEGTVGVGTATAFFTFAKSLHNKYSINSIIEGKKLAPPDREKRDILFSLAIETTHRINSYIAEALTNPEYIAVLKETDADKKTKVLVKVLGKNVQAIENLYSWFAQDAIDPSFQVLINKYQNRETADHLRIALVLRDEFKVAKVAYEKIAKVLVNAR